MSSLIHQYNLLEMVHKLIRINIGFFLLLFSFLYYYQYYPSEVVYAYYENEFLQLQLTEKDINKLKNKTLKIDQEKIAFEIVEIGEKLYWENERAVRTVTLKVDIEASGFYEIVIIESPTTLLKQIKKYMKENL